MNIFSGISFVMFYTFVVGWIVALSWELYSNGLNKRLAIAFEMVDVDKIPSMTSGVM